MAAQPLRRARSALRSASALVAALAVVAGAFVVAAPAHAAQGGTITGTVTDAAGGVYANVSLLGPDVVDTSALTAQTDPSNGSFEIGNVPLDHAYTVQAVPADDGAGHDSAADLTVWSGGASGVTSQAIAGTVTPTAVDPAVDVTLVTSLGASVSGRVVDASNSNTATNGLAGVDVQVQLAAGTVVGASATTAGDGSYTLQGLPSGDYYVYADPSASPATGVADYGALYYPAAGSIAATHSLHLTAGNPTVTGKNVLLTSGGEIDGVVDNGGSPAAPIPGATVTVYSAGVAIASDNSTGADGTFQIKGVPAGSDYTIGVATPTGSAYLDAGVRPLSAFTTGSVSPNTPLALSSPIHLATGLTISGTVTDGHAGIPGVSVSASGNTDGANGNSPVTTDSSGAYSIIGLTPDETYDVTADGSAVHHTTSVTTTSTVTSNLTHLGFTLTSGGTIKGSVFTDAGAGHPAVDAVVTLVTTSGVTVATKNTDGDGAYEFDGIALGTSYTIAVAAPDGSPDLDSAAQTVVGPATPGGVITVPAITLPLGATISGTVKSDTGVGLVGAVVTATGQNTSATGSAITAAGGAYSITGLPGDVYDVAVDGSAATDVTTTGFTSVSTTLSAPIAAGATQVVPFTLTSAGDITGTVLDHTTPGVPIVGAIVIVYRGATQVGTATSGAGGAFDVPGVPGAVAGTYTVEVDAPAQSPDLDKTGIPVGTVTPGHATAVDPIRLQLGATISGVVTNSATPPAGLADATVTVTGRNTAATTSATTASDGSYSITGLPADTYDVAIDDSAAGYALWTSPAAGYTVAAAGSTTVSAQLTNGGTVAGTVLDDQGHAVSGSDITLYQGQTTVATALTSANGSFSLLGVPAGTGYTIVAGAPTGSPDVDSAVTTVGAVTASHLTDVPITLIKGGAISGVVTNDANPPVPLAGIVVEADGTTNGATPTATTKSDGSYTIIGLPADTSYTVFTTDPSGTYATKTVTTAAIATGASASTLAENFTLTSAGWVVGPANSVLTSSGHPAVGATVNIVSVDGQGNQTVLGSGNVGANGGFTALGIPAGTGYQLDVVPTPGSTDLETLSTGTIPAVKPGLQTDLTATYQLQPGATISGTVTDGSTPPNPVSGAVISITGATTSGGGTVTTDGNGRFALSGLPADTYSVQVDATAKGFGIQTTASVVVAAGATLTPALSYQLVPGVTVTGTVLTSAGAGHPAFGANVTLQTAPDAQGGSTILGTTRTGPDGTWSIPGVGPTSDAQLVITAPDGSTDIDYGPTTISAAIPAPSESVKSVAISLPSVPGGVVTLTPGAIISGHIDGNGTDLGTVTVSVFSTDGSLTDVADSAPLTLTATGVDYSIGRLPAGRYYVEAIPPGDGSAYAAQWLGGPTAQTPDSTTTKVTVTAGQTSSAHNLTLLSGGTFSGTVKDTSHAAVSGATINVYYWGDGWGTDTTDPANPVSNGDGTHVAKTSPPTGADGSFSITGLAPGRYTADAEDATDENGNVGGLVNVFYPKNPATIDPAQFSYTVGDANNGSFTVGTGTTTNWAALLPHAGSITLTVLNPDGTVDATAAPAIYNTAGDPVGTIATDPDTGAIVPDSNGSYTYTSVPPGKYTASVTLSDGTTEYLGGVFYYDQSDPASLAKAWYTLTSSPGTTTPYTIRLAKVAGTVTDAKGKVSHAQVSILEGDPSGTELSDDGTSTATAATTNSKGAFTFEPVIATGTYAPAYTFQVDSGDDAHQVSQQYTGIAAGPSLAFALNLLFAATPKPIVTGSAVAKGTLAVVVPWTPTPTSTTYQWRLGGTAIAGATKATYTVPKGTKAGAKISVTVTAAAKGYASASATSAAVLVGKAFSEPAAPAIAGTPAVGTPAYVKLPAWAGGPAFAYQWLANGRAIRGAAKATYAPTASLAGAKLSVIVTATKSGFATTTLVSKAVVVAKALKTKPSIALALPKKLVVGQKVTVKVTNAAKLKGAKLTYQWFANRFAIPSATKPAFALTKAQVGVKLTVLVTATAKGAAANVLSTATGAVKAK